MRLFTFLLRLLSLTALISGITATQAAATERIRFLFNNNGDRSGWFEAAGAWSVARGKYIGRPKQDPEAFSFFLGLSEDEVSTVSGDVVMNVPKEGKAFVIVRGDSHTKPNGKRTASGYFLGLLNRAGNTHLRVFVRDENGEEKVLCDKLIKPSNAAGFLSLNIHAGGSAFSVSTGGVECRGFDRSFGSGRFGLMTRGGSNQSVFKVETIDVIVR